MLGDYQDAQLERARQAACFVAFVRDSNPDSPGPTAAPGEELGDILKPGLIEMLPPGKDISFANQPPPSQDNSFWPNILPAVPADYWCARGQDENFIKKMKNDLASDRYKFRPPLKNSRLRGHPGASVGR